MIFTRLHCCCTHSLRFNAQRVFDVWCMFADNVVVAVRGLCTPCACAYLNRNLVYVITGHLLLLVSYFVIPLKCKILVESASLLIHGWHWAYFSCFRYRLNGSSSPVLTATSRSYGNAPKIRPPQNRNPWSDWDKIWHGWLRRRGDPHCKITGWTVVQAMF